MPKKPDASNVLRAHGAVRRRRSCGGESGRVRRRDRAFTGASLRWPEAARPLCERGAILILQRKYAEAVECYARLGGRYHPRKERYGRDLVLEDLRLLQAAGVQVPRAGLVPAALGGPFSTR